MKIPCIKTLGGVLKEKFNLRYGKLETANLKYRDPTYNEKRLWVSRLLAQLMYEDVIIVTVDESNFRSDALPSRQWAFNEAIIGK